MRARCCKNAHQPIISTNAWAMRIYRIHSTFAQRGAMVTLSACWHIHLSLNIDAIVAFVQRLKPFTPGVDLEPPAWSFWGVLEPYLAALDTNKHDTSYRSTFVVASPINDATSSAMVKRSIANNTNARRGPSTRCDANIPRAPEAHGITNPEGTSLLNYGIQWTISPLYPTWIRDPIGRFDGWFPTNLATTNELTFEGDTIRVSTI